MARLGRAEGWTLGGRLEARVKLLFSTWGQEQMIERTFQRLRDSETRDTAAKSLRNWRAWEVAVSTGMMNSFERREVKANTTMSSAGWGADVDVFGRCGPTAAEHELQQILKAQSWDTFNAQSEKKIPAELCLMRYLQSEANEVLVDKVWLTAILPLHQVILYKPVDDGPKKMFFTIYVSEVGALSWPVVKVGSGQLMLDSTSGARPEWRWIFRLKAVQVVPLKPLSPLHAFFKPGVGLNRAGVMMQISRPVDLLDFQARRGFVGVGEHFLRKLHGEQKFGLPDHPNQDIGAEESLAMNLVHKLLPDIDCAEFKQIMRYRIDHSDDGMKDASCADVLDTDVMLDLSTRGDQKVAKEFQHDVAKAAARKDKLARLCDDAIMARLPASRRRPTETPAARLALDAKLHTAKGANRWWASIVPGARFLTTWAPPESNIVEDLPNGRWLLSAPGRDRRSISWTKRGSEQGVADALRVLWEWHCQSTGGECPIPDLLTT